MGKKIEIPMIGFAVLFFSVCHVSMATEEKRSTYIVHMAKFYQTFGVEEAQYFQSSLESVSTTARPLYTYKNVMNGYSVSLTLEESQSLRNLPEVLSVFPETKYELHTTRTPWFLGLGAPLFSPTLNSQATSSSEFSTPGFGPRARASTTRASGPSRVTGEATGLDDTGLEDNVNVMSLSLGGVAVPYYLDPVAMAAFAATEKGIIVICSAGNSGPNVGSVANVAPWMTTVGAGTLDRDFPAPVTLGNGKQYAGISLYGPWGRVVAWKIVSLCLRRECYDRYFGWKPLCARNSYSGKGQRYNNFSCNNKKGSYSSGLGGLNYPSFAVPVKYNYDRNGKPVVVKHVRTLTNVGDGGTYKVRVVSPSKSVKISVLPKTLTFNGRNEKKLYAVTFKVSPNMPEYSNQCGRIEWYDENKKHVVGSPVAFSWISDI